MRVPKLSEEEMLQFIQENWERLPEKKRARIEDCKLEFKYRDVYRHVKREEYEKEKGEDTYPIYTLKRLLKYKKLTIEDIAEMKRLVDEAYTYTKCLPDK